MVRVRGATLQGSERDAGTKADTGDLAVVKLTDIEKHIVDWIGDDNWTVEHLERWLNEVEENAVGRIRAEAYLEAIRAIADKQAMVL
jgi:hypothetical protein